MGPHGGLGHSPTPSSDAGESSADGQINARKSARGAPARTGSGKPGSRGWCRATRASFGVQKHPNVCGKREHRCGAVRREHLSTFRRVCTGRRDSPVRIGVLPFVHACVREHVRHMFARTGDPRASPRTVIGTAKSPDRQGLCRRPGETLPNAHFRPDEVSRSHDPVPTGRSTPRAVPPFARSCTMSRAYAHATGTRERVDTIPTA